MSISGTNEEMAISYKCKNGYTVKTHMKNFNDIAALRSVL
jgi:hypothetical protein